MVRHATWVRRPEDPRTVCGWVLGNGLGVPPARRWTLGRLALVATLLFGFSLALPFPVPLFVALAGVAGVAVVAKPGAREHAEMPTLGEHEVFPVTLDLRGAKGRLVGRERGWIAFVDGWLVYEGLRTSFAVDAPSLERARRRMWEVRLDLPGGGRARLILLADALPTERPAAWRDRRRLASAFEAWLGHPPRAGEPVMPPREAHPSILGDRLRSTLALTVGFSVFALGGVLAGVVWVMVVGLAGFVAGLVCSARASRRLARRLQGTRSV